MNFKSFKFLNNFNFEYLMTQYYYFKFDSQDFNLILILN